MNSRSAFGSALTTVLTLGLAACGGGGGSTDAGAAQTTPVPSSANASLSETQANFEDAALHGGVVTPATWVIQSGSSVLLSQLELPTIALAQSPLGAAVPVQAVLTLDKPELPQTTTPFWDDADPRHGVAVLQNGRIEFVSGAAAPTFAYAGADVISQTPNTKGTGSIALKITSNVKVPLSGTFASMPAELRAAFGNDPRLTSDLTFAAGSAYYRQTRVRVGEMVALQDRDNDPTTDAYSATPFATGSTIEAYAASASVDLAKGQIRTVTGARRWIGPQQTGPTASPGTLPALCEVGGNVYAGSYQADGAEVGMSVASGSTMVHSSSSFRLNQLAARSIANMLRSTQVATPYGMPVPLASGHWALVPAGAVIKDTSGNTINVSGVSNVISVAQGAVVTVPGPSPAYSGASLVIAR